MDFNWVRISGMPDVLTQCHLNPFSLLGRDDHPHNEIDQQAGDSARDERDNHGKAEPKRADPIEFS